MTQPDPSGGLGYAAAGVDTGAGDRAVELIREHVARTLTAAAEAFAELEG